MDQGPIRCILSFVFCFLLNVEVANGQLDNRLFFRSVQADSIEEKRLSFRFSGLGFHKNNEFFNQIVEGYTLFGYQAQPTIFFQPSAGLTLEAGLFLWSDFGTDAFTQVLPTFTVKYQKNNFTFLFGNLEGNLQHELIEPILDFERVIQQRLEHGAQFKWKGQRFSTDLWIDWQQMIYQSSNFQEELWAGATFSWKAFKHKHWYVSPALQLSAFHRGGQINIGGSAVTTTTHFAIGGSIGWRQFTNETFIQGVEIQPWWIGMQHQGGGSAPYNRGFGFYPNLLIKTRLLDAMLSYWHGSNFFSPLGGDLYQGQAVFGNQNYLEPERRLLFLRLLKDWEITEGFAISARAEPFYDFTGQALELSFGFYLHYDYQFLLKKL